MPIKFVGIELEGGWKKPPEGTILTHDVSVMAPQGFSPHKGHWGEAVSPKLEADSGWKTVLDWIKHNYPSHIPKTLNVGTQQERSCGLHIHVSFEDASEYRMTVQKHYHQWLLDGYKEWGKANLPNDHIFWHRWKGGNRFCTREFTPHVQMKWKEKGHNRPDRRTHLNYTWGYLGTVEFRMLPMFPDPLLRAGGDEKVLPGDVVDAIEATKVFLNLTNEWLVREAAKEREREVLHRSLIMALEQKIPMVIEKEFDPRKRKGA